MLDSELTLINNLVFKPCGLELTDLKMDLESKEYLAQNFKLDRQNIKFRKAKITPKKIGQFVAIWKRNAKGITEPLHISDDFDFYIIAARIENRFGIFIFGKAVLYENRIVSDDEKEGKRGIRVYPTWDLTNSKQAQKTQNWQTKYFLELSHDDSTDLKMTKNLLSVE